jgi:hypothetical protein
MKCFLSFIRTRILEVSLLHEYCGTGLWEFPA